MLQESREMLSRQKTVAYRLTLLISFSREYLIGRSYNIYIRVPLAKLSQSCKFLII